MKKTFIMLFIAALSLMAVPSVYAEGFVPAVVCGASASYPVDVGMPVLNSDSVVINVDAVKPQFRSLNVNLAVLARNTIKYKYENTAFNVSGNPGIAILSGIPHAGVTAV